MANRPNKALAEYIHQGDLIEIADDSAIAAGELWAIIPVTRTKHDALLATLKAKATTADTIGPAYDLKVEEKDGFDLDAEKATSMLAVYIENAFPDNAEQINHTLLLDEVYPADDEKAKQYLTSVLAAIAVHDNATYPIPPAYTNAIDTAASNFISTLAEVTDLFENRRTAIQDRNLALEEFIDVLSPIRKWLWKTLPQGRADTRLIDYGFDPYNAQPSEPEPEPGEVPQLPTAPEGLNVVIWREPSLMLLISVGPYGEHTGFDLCKAETPMGMMEPPDRPDENLVSNLPLDVEPFGDGEVMPGMKYWYWARARNGEEVGDWTEPFGIDVE